MPDPVLRVALLARAGEARDQLRRALSEAGADVVAEGDPAELDPGTVAGRQPAVVVVSLEPAIEDALAEFDDLLAMPGVQVIYDDAEVTRELDGWDLARWARHLASKLAGTDFVLPPVPSDAGHVPEAADSLQPGAPPTPAEEMDHHRLEDYAAESVDLSEWVPATPSLTDATVETAPGGESVAAAGEAAPDLDLELDLDLAGLEEAMTAPVPDAGVQPVAGDETPLSFDADGGDAVEATTDDGSAPDLGEFLDLSVTEAFEQAEASAPATDDAAGDEPLLIDFEIPDGPVNFSSFANDDDLSPAAVDDDVAALAAQLDAFDAQGARDEPSEPDFSRHVDEPAPFGAPRSLDAPADTAPVGKAQAPAGFGTLSLEPMDDDAPPAESPFASAPPRPATPEKAKSAPAIDFGSLSLVDDDAAPTGAPPAAKPASAPPAAFSTAGLSLVEDEATAMNPMFAAPAAATPEASAREPAGAVRGALFVVAGLGGPDGVRQLLSALPASLPVPVLLYQHLDTGKHDRLVGQLSKASKLPVELAVDGGAAAAGRVAVLPPGIGVAARGDAFAFVSGATLASIVAALPASDSAVLILSGGDPAVVPAAKAMAIAGGAVFAQDPASCFDAGAPQAAISAGATTGALPDVARRILERWS